MIQIKCGSPAYKIIMLLLITGEFPFRSLGILGNERWFKATAVRMTQYQDVRMRESGKCYRCKLITISGKSNLRTIRLCRSSFELISEEMAELLSNYMIDTYGHRFHGQERITERNHRIAEVSLVCMRSGIECRTHLIPRLQKQEKKYLNFTDPAFYSSKTIKRLDVDEMNKSKYIRMVGAIFSQAGLYEIYNSRSDAMEWYGQGEDKSILIMEDVCRYNFPISDCHRAIIFGNEYDVALETLHRFESGDKYVQLDLLGYQSMHFLPMDESGIKLLQIMMIKNWDQMLLRLIFEIKYIPDVKEFNYDARIDDVYVLSFLDSDIIKLASFYKTVTQEKFKWEVACFDTQLPFLRKYLGEEAVIRSFPLDLIHEKLNAGKEALI